jgi:hypothetical protein
MHEFVEHLSFSENDHARRAALIMILGAASKATKHWDACRKEGL